MAFSKPGELVKMKSGYGGEPIHSMHAKNAIHDKSQGMHKQKSVPFMCKERKGERYHEEM